MGILAWICGFLCLGFHKLAARAAALTGNRSNSRITEVGRFWFLYFRTQRLGFSLLSSRGFPQLLEMPTLLCYLGFLQIIDTNSKPERERKRGREIPSSKTDNKYSCNIMKWHAYNHVHPVIFAILYWWEISYKFYLLSRSGDHLRAWIAELVVRRSHQGISIISTSVSTGQYGLIFISQPRRLLITLLGAQTEMLNP